MGTTHLYVNFLSKLTRPGEPSAAANVGQNFCHRNAVKCGFVCTFFGNAVVSVRIHSVRYNDPQESLFFGVPTLKIFISMSRIKENMDKEKERWKQKDKEKFGE